jgi:uncharacterized protein
MALPKTLKLMQVFIDGASWLGECEDFTPAKLTRKTSPYRGGGLLGSVLTDQGYADNALDTTFTFGGFNDEIQRRVGITKLDGITLRFAGSFQRDDTAAISSVEIYCRGKFTDTDPGTWKSGESSQHKVTMANVYYKVVVDGQVLNEIDLVNFIDVGPDGVDRLAEHRKAIGS